MTKNEILKKINIIDKAVDDVILFDKFKLAFNIYHLLDNIKKEETIKNDRELLKHLSDLQITSQWIALPLFKENEIIGLFNKHLSTYFEIPEYNIIEKLRHYLLGIIMIEDRDKFKEKLINGLNVNNYMLTKTPIDGYGSPTVENWIKYYTSKHGTKSVSPLKLREFFTSDSQFVNLEEDDRERVARLINLYEFLKLSSSSGQGYEGIVPVNTTSFKGYIHDSELIRESKPDPRLDKILKVIRGEKIYVGNIDSLGPPKTEEEKKIEEYKEAEERLASSDLEKKVIDEAGIQAQRRIEDLKILAKKYSKNSLEQKAIQEEIKKLERGN